MTGSTSFHDIEPQQMPACHFLSVLTKMECCGLNTGRAGLHCGPGDVKARHYLACIDPGL